MNGFDTFLIGLIIGCLLLGFRVGIIRQVLVTVALYLGVVIAMLGYEGFGRLLKGVFHNIALDAAYMVAFFLITLVVTAVLIGVTIMVYQQTSIDALGVWDQLAGGFVGIGTSLLLIGVLMIIFRFAMLVDWGTANNNRDAMNISQRGSFLAPVVAPASQYTLASLKPWVQGDLPVILKP